MLPRLLAVASLAGLAYLGACAAETEPGTDTGTAVTCRNSLDVSLDCADCIEAHCCEPAARCAEDFTCKPCIMPGDRTVCNAPAPAAADELISCLHAHCTDVCAPPFVDRLGDAGCEAPPAEPPSGGACVAFASANVSCNPVTNQGCGPQEACDVLEGEFVCFLTGNVRARCEPCGYGSHDFCLGGSHCVGRCAGFCCDDGDCGPGARCDFDFLRGQLLGSPPPAVGLCLAAP